MPGFDVLRRLRIRCGTAIPTKATGPAKAVTHADRRLDSRISPIRSARTLTPRFTAYASPICQAPIGFDSKTQASMPPPVTIPMTITFCQFTPEKLPCAQVCRFTILESFANVRKISVTALQKYPIRTPLMIRMVELPDTPDTRRTNAIDIIAPAKAAPIIPQEFSTIPFSSSRIIMIATKSFAPEETPSTKGPARGLRKKVCNKYPDTDRAPPRINALKSLGKRRSNRMAAASASPFPASALMIRGNESAALPVIRFAAERARTMAASSRYPHANLKAPRMLCLF